MSERLVKVRGQEAFRDTRSKAIVFSGGQQYKMALKRRALSRQVAMHRSEQAKATSRVHSLHDRLAHHEEQIAELHRMHRDLLKKVNKDKA